jgi:hypothetical protein
VPVVFKCSGSGKSNVQCLNGERLKDNEGAQDTYMRRSEQLPGSKDTATSETTMKYKIQEPTHFRWSVTCSMVHPIHSAQVLMDPCHEKKAPRPTNPFTDLASN